MSLKISQEPFCSGPLLLERVNDKETVLVKDLEIGVKAFEHAFADSTPVEIQANFGSRENIRPYYTRLIQQDDQEPFRQGKAVWIRAFLHDELIGWMTLFPGFQEANSVYLSTLVLSIHRRGFGSTMLSSIRGHWIPDVDKIYIITRRINLEAIKCFSKNGYKEVSGIVSPFLDDEKTCFFMVNTRSPSPRL